MKAIVTPDMPCYTLEDAYKMLACSDRTVSRIFKKETGLIYLEHEEKGNQYDIIRIPTAVFNRVIDRMVR